MKDLAQGILLYRNHNSALTRMLHKVSSRRHIMVEMDYRQEDDTVHLAAIDQDGNRAELILNMPYEEPRDPSMAREQVEKHLSSTGNTPFKVVKIDISRRIGFSSISFLNGIRRNVLAELERIRFERFPCEATAFIPNSIPYPVKQLDYRANVLNEHARHFYKRHGAEILEPAFETLSEKTGREVMRTRYCLRYELDACDRFGPSHCRLKEPLQISDRHHGYLLKFDCEACRMSLIFLGRKRE